MWNFRTTLIWLDRFFLLLEGPLMCYITQELNAFTNAHGIRSTSIVSPRWKRGTAGRSSIERIKSLSIRTIPSHIRHSKSILLDIVLLYCWRYYTCRSIVSNLFRSKVCLQSVFRGTMIIRGPYKGVIEFLIHYRR